MRISRSLLIAIPLIFAAAGYAYWTTYQGQKYQSHLGGDLRERLGFTHGSPYVIAGEEKIEVFTVYPEADGFLYAAGFRSGDIVTSESITGFYRLLYQNAGKPVSVVVVPGGDGPPISLRKKRKFEFTLPDDASRN